MLYVTYKYHNEWCVSNISSYKVFYLVKTQSKSNKRKILSLASKPFHFILELYQVKNVCADQSVWKT